MIRLVQKVPAVRLLVPYLVGVLFVSSHSRLAWSSFLFGLWALIVHRFLEKHLPSVWSVRWIPGLGFACLWVGLGAFSAGYEQKKASFPMSDSVTLTAVVKVLSVPVSKPKTYQFEVRIQQADNRKWVGKHLQLYVAKDERSACIELGESLLLNVKPQKASFSNNSSGFDYAAWLRTKGICGTAYVSASSWNSQSSSSLFNLKSQAEKMRTRLLSCFSQAGIRGEEYSLVSALTLGSVQLLTPETKKEFSVSGVSHILSVSGLHVAIVFAILEFLLVFFNRMERLKMFKQLIIIALLWCYAFMTGLSPSVIRSAFMFSLIAFGSCLHRRSQTINTVLFSAFMLLLWRPTFLFDLGFQLSYCAVLSIVVFHKPLAACWKPKTKMVGYFWEMICLSLVAQLGTAPLTIYYFNQFPNYFLINNLVAVPLSGLILYLACGFLLVGSIPYLGGVLAWCLNQTLHGFQSFVRFTSELPHALSENLVIKQWEVVFFYLLMLAFYVWICQKRRNWIFAFLVCVIVLQVLSFG